MTSLLDNMDNLTVSTCNFTYRDLTKPAKRLEMRNVGVATLGTQAGGFGSFWGEFKTVSEKAKVNISNEIHLSCINRGIDMADLLDDCPTLKDLLK